jgi:hypothetical protein
VDLAAQNAKLAHELAESQEREKALRKAIEDQLVIHAAHVRELNHTAAMAVSLAQQQAGAERARADALSGKLRAVKSGRHRATTHNGDL